MENINEMVYAYVTSILEEAGIFYEHNGVMEFIYHADAALKMVNVDLTPQVTLLMYFLFVQGITFGLAHPETEVSVFELDERKAN